ncbi:MAG: hypothetical protein ACSHXF_06075 [Aquaticitalea sp.]
MSKSKKLLFITTSSLASNPRLVKEFESLKNDFDCFVMCFRHQDWSFELSEAIKVKNPEVTFIEIDRHSAVVQTILCKITHKASIKLSRIFKNSFKICAFASNDKAQQLWLETQSLYQKHNFSRVIAHNLGAFYAAVKLSEERNIKLQLDIEDFYPGEALYFNKGQEKQNRMHIMAYSFLRANDITYASEGILLECQKHFKVNNQTEQLLIINAFAADDFIEPKNRESEMIQCVWFSQHIGPNRGLEQVFEAAKHLSNFQFHLIGNRNEGFLNTVEITENIIIHEIMEQSSLHAFLANMDIGLALEPGKDLNNTVALSNKMIAYAQAGCYIFATNTFGQSQFLNSLDYDAGIIIKNALKEQLQSLEINQLQKDFKTNRWQKAKSFSWEKEQLKLKQLLS